VYSGGGALTDPRSINSVSRPPVQWIRDQCYI